ncbi:hypothetical protein CDIK_0506 [Cucumispora dikerogammari]|nr:hypothetical protein CDIK_0506 [Cucumispora dikerogammari]
MKQIRKNRSGNQRTVDKLKSIHIEKQRDALKRLKTLRENERKHKKLIILSKKTTGKEYFFKMHNCENINGEIVPKIKTVLSKYDKNKILYEITRIENKLKRMIPTFTAKKINLETGLLLETEHRQNDDREQYETYLKELKHILK